MTQTDPEALRRIVAQYKPEADNPLAPYSIPVATVDLRALLSALSPQQARDAATVLEAARALDRDTALQSVAGWYSSLTTLRSAIQQYDAAPQVTSSPPPEPKP